VVTLFSLLPTIVAMGYADCVKDANLLLSLTPAERKAVLKVLDARRVKSICECAHNLLQGNIAVSDKRKLHKLRKHKSALRRLASRGECWIRKRRYLVQKGGGFLIPILLSAALQTALHAATS